MPGAAQLVATQLEAQLAARERLVRVFERDPDAAVPHDRLAGAVVALGDHAFEVGVLDGMVLDLHGEPLLAGIERRTFRHRPRAQHAAVLEPQVVVEAARRVLLDAEEARMRPGRRGGGGRRPNGSSAGPQAGRTPSAVGSPPNGSGVRSAERFAR